MTENQSYYCTAAFVEGDWQQDVVISVGDDGNIRTIESDVPQGSASSVGGVVIPGIPNVHSHAFQRAFAGLCESRREVRDSFWTWRQQMYEFARHLTPEDVYDIARQLYVEMLKRGYTSVGEFHYLHNSPSGASYDQIDIMLDAVTRAAVDVGMGFCALPVLYQRGGFRELQADRLQRRFTLSEDTFFALTEKYRERWQVHPNVFGGLAIHSLRAVDIAVASRVTKTFIENRPDEPIHVHLAEQRREVDDCIEAHGRSPLELLLGHCRLNERWCLIHATHISYQEAVALSHTGALVGLCPTTEANLADGRPPIEQLFRLGIGIAIGSGSHVSVDPRSELRLLEYVQRLDRHARILLCTDSQSVARTLLEQSWSSGARALGMNSGQLSVGQRADWLVVDPEHPTVAGASNNALLDRWLFCDAGNPIHHVMVNGQWVVRDGTHASETESARRFVAAVRHIQSR